MHRGGSRCTERAKAPLLLSTPETVHSKARTETDTSRSSVDLEAQEASTASLPQPSAAIHSLSNTCVGKLRQMPANWPRIWGWASFIGKGQKGVTIKLGQMESFIKHAPEILPYLPPAGISLAPASPALDCVRTCPVRLGVSSS